MKLNELNRERVNKLISESSDFYEIGNRSKSIDLLEKAWQELPGVKYLYDESYHIARYLTKIFLESDNFELAKNWAFEVMKCDPERPDIGEKEFLVGKVLFESGEQSEALEYFRIANDKSEGMCFEGEDKKYNESII